ncbi:hypothetical protein AMS68_002505 [Peltaster fructicola]|uniref:Uncharacterized protein n=1 Tax=Peltaster fructicola TaxID=286661 RepID=A0A6H0XQR8_9PEZI|nr:hypothetical protein AMS68_002505 [Peltaster fructicola]
MASSKWTSFSGFRDVVRSSNIDPLLLIHLSKMCGYVYAYYYCGCDYYIQNDTIEFCANRNLSAHSPDVWSDDMCDKKEVKCAGISNFYCRECSEDHLLEYDLDE